MAGPSFRFLGTGNAFNIDGRGSQAIVAEGAAGGPPFLIDVGPTALAAIGRFGVDCRSLDRLFLTHLHGDHTAGWPFLLLHLVLLERRSRPFEILGPVGTRERLEGLVRLCYPELPAMQVFDLCYRELPVEQASGLATGDGLVFDVYPMQHDPSSIAYRFHLQGLRVAVSGDTAWCPDLERLGDGSDLLILECTSLHPQPGDHISLDELRHRRPSLGAPQVLLVHLTDAVAEELARDPIPGVIATYDGFEFPGAD